MRLAFWILPCALFACTAFPELDGVTVAADRNAAYPALVPLEPLIRQANAATQTRITPASVATLDSRIVALRDRANGLRGPVIDPATRTRLTRAIRTPL